MTRPTFITLGPEGTCHENALRHYLAFQGVGDFDLVLVEDLLGAIGRVREQPNTFLVQCSAHVQVHLVTERYHEDVFVIDTFIYPTKELGLLLRNDVSEHRSLGIVSATRGYLDLARFATIVDQPSKPVVARNLLAGEFDAGLTHVHHVEEHPDELRLVEYYGAVDTTWLVYGARKRFKGAVIGQRAPWLFCDEAHLARPRAGGGMRRPNSPAAERQPRPGSCRATMRAPGRIGLLAAVGALAPCAGLVAACGEGRPAPTATRARAVTQPAQPTDPRAVVAQVGPYSITEATLERFTRVRLSGEPAAERVVPPNFSACVAHLQAESAARDEPASGSTQLRSECQTRYERLRQAALDGLIADDWLIGAARELRAPIGGNEANPSVQLKAKLANEAIKRAVIERVKPVTQAQIANYYRQHRFQYLVTGERDVRIARSETPASAAEVRAELTSGKSFATVVRQSHVRQADYSKEGLVLELKPREYGEPKLNKAIFAAKPGVLSGVVGTSFGYFVFEVTKVRFEDERPLKEVEASIRRQLSAPLQERALKAFFKQWRATWKVRTDCQAGYVVPDCR